MWVYLLSLLMWGLYQYLTVIDIPSMLTEGV
jgi:hypothetical protein